MKNSTTVKPATIAPDSRFVTAAVIAAGATNSTATSSFSPSEFSPRTVSGGSGFLRRAAGATDVSGWTSDGEPHHFGEAALFLLSSLRAVPRKWYTVGANQAIWDKLTTDEMGACYRCRCQPDVQLYRVPR
jgi:hypothetical protein